MTTTAHEDQFTPAPVEVTQGDRTEAIRIGQLIADRCQPPRKPGQAPERYDTIMQAAKMGALEAMKNTRTASAPAGEVEPVAWMYSRNHESLPPSVQVTRRDADEMQFLADKGWTEEALCKCAHPPAPADLVEAARASIEGAGEVEKRLLSPALVFLTDTPASHSILSEICGEAAATIAALKAQIERLTERAAQDKLNGVRAGIEAAKEALNTAKGVNKAALWDVNHILGKLKDCAEAIAKGEG